MRFLPILNSKQRIIFNSTIHAHDCPCRINETNQCDGSIIEVKEIEAQPVMSLRILGT